MKTPSLALAPQSSPMSDVRAVPPRNAASEGPRAGRLGAALELAAFASISAIVAALGARVTIENKGWYRLLRKSRLTPPDRTFSVVWPVLYGLGTLSAWRIARTSASPTRTRALTLWGTQLACNAAWTPLFFGAHRPRAALTALILNTASLAAYAVEARKIDSTAAVMVVPNLGWLAFAGVLNAAVIRRNARGFRWVRD